MEDHFAPGIEYVEERGPEAAASKARARGVTRLDAWEGGGAYTGTDGNVSCVYTNSMMAAEFAIDPSDAELRGDDRTQRFASLEDRERWIASRRADIREAVGDRRERVVERLNAPKPDAQKTPADEDFRIEVENGMSGFRQLFMLQRREGKYLAVFASDPGSHSSGARFQLKRKVSTGAAAQFRAEMYLVDPYHWPDHVAPGATDLTSWHVLRASGGGYRKTGPFFSGFGEMNPDHEIKLMRTLMAAERLAGRNIWDYDRAVTLDSIGDTQARREHAILDAIRAWAADAMAGESDPGSIIETTFEEQLVPYLERDFGSAKSRYLKGNATREPVLEQWPNVGDVDLELVDRMPVDRAWLELKWTKSASSLTNCAWDAPKLAEGLRAGEASAGYLVAGAPISAWKTAKVRHLFGSWCGASSECVELYGVRSWREEPAAIGQESLPDRLITTPVGDVNVSRPDGSTWLIKIARVDSPGKGRCPLPPLP